MSQQTTSFSAHKTVELISELIRIFHTLFHTSTPQIIKKESNTAIEEAKVLIDDADSCTLFTRLSKFLQKAPSNYPGLKTSEFHITQELIFRLAAKERPEYFSSLMNDNNPISSDMIFGIATKFLQEFVQEGGLNKLVESMKNAVEKSEHNTSKETWIEFIEVVKKNFIYVGTYDISDPSKDPLNKYVDQNDIKRILELRESLKSKPNDVEYDKVQREFSEVRSRIEEQRHKALKEGTEYITSLLKLVITTKDLRRYIEEKADADNQKEFEKYILENYNELLEPNILRSFWEYIHREQLGPTFYKMFCESFREAFKEDQPRQIVQALWAISLLDTVHITPQEAKSRMVTTSFDGQTTSNFGYNMVNSQAYKEWSENPLARACGDIIIDSHHSLVNFGRNLDVEAFLNRFKIFLKNVKERTEEDFHSHEYDKYTLPFKHFVLKNLKKTFKEKGNIEEAMKKEAEYIFNYLSVQKNQKSIKGILENFKSFCRKEVLVLGIGFNGNEFSTPTHFYYKNNNEICLGFSKSGRNNGGDLLLSFLKYAAEQSSRDLIKLEINNSIFQKYKFLIKKHISDKLQKLKSPPYNTLGHIKTEISKVENFQKILEQDLSFDDLYDNFKEWVLNLDNWYKVPINSRIKILDNLEYQDFEKERQSLEFSTKLLFDVFTLKSFSSKHENLMPLLFNHWKTELLEQMSTKTEFSELRSVIESAV